jgi:hypothetical protein
MKERSFMNKFLLVGAFCAAFVCTSVYYIRCQDISTNETSKVAIKIENESMSIPEQSPVGEPTAVAPVTEELSLGDTKKQQIVPASSSDQLDQSISPTVDEAVHSTEPVTTTELEPFVPGVPGAEPVGMEPMEHVVAMPPVTEAVPTSPSVGDDLAVEITK